MYLTRVLVALGKLLNPHRRRLSWWERCRYGLNDLSFRPALTGMVGVPMVVTLLYFLLAGFYAHSFYAYQRAQLDANNPDSLTADTPDVADPSKRFTRALLQEISGWPHVRAVRPRVELGAKVSTPGGRCLDVSLVSTAVDDGTARSTRLEWGRPVVGEGAEEMLLPEDLFLKLGGTMTPAGPVPDRLQVEVARTTDGRAETHHLSLRVVGLLKARSHNTLLVPLQTAVHLDQWCSHQIDTVPTPGALIELPRLEVKEYVVWGPADQAERVPAEARALGADIRVLGDIQVLEGPETIWAVQRDSHRTQSPAGLSSLVSTVPGCTLHEGYVSSAIGREPGFLVAAPNTTDPRRARTLLHSDRLGLVCELRSMPREVGVQLPTVNYRPLRETLERAGWELRPLATMGERHWRYYQARATVPERAAELGTALELSQPTFQGVLPVVRRAATRQGKTLNLEASRANDPRRFRAAPLFGRWLRPGAEPEIVLPAAVAQEWFPGRPPGECYGERVELTFTRERQLTRADPSLTVTVEVVGVSTGEGQSPVVPLDWLCGVSLWSQGRVVYNETTRRFESPASIYERQGHARADIEVTDPAAVGEVVRRLERAGYRTESRLAEQENLHFLGRVLAAFVLFVLAGFLGVALITMLSHNAQKIDTKTHEIGVLRAHGVGTGEILSIFVIQGLVTGTVAFLVAGALVAGLEPLLTGLLRSTFQLPPDALRRLLASSEYLWLFGLALLLALTATTAGALIPAWRACRLSPVEAMRYRP